MYFKIFDLYLHMSLDKLQRDQSDSDCVILVALDIPLFL